MKQVEIKGVLLSFSFSKKYFENRHFVVMAQSQNYTSSTLGSENKIEDWSRDPVEI